MKNAVYKIVTERIINMLREGLIPWERPFITSLNAAKGYEMKPGETYTGINRILIPNPGEYLTRNMVEKHGGEIINKDDFYIATFFKMIPVKQATDDCEDVEIAGYRPCFRYYRVYHISNTTGIRSKMEGREETAIRYNADADAIIADWRSRTGFGTSEDPSAAEPTYNPADNLMSVPRRTMYINDESYYSALFHGIVLSAQKQIKGKSHAGLQTVSDEAEFTCERLIAEMGASMLMSCCGLDNSKVTRNSAARIQGWLKALQADERLVESASRQAEKAVRLILNEPAERQNDVAEAA